MERDISADVKTVNNFISTHTLTWSVTCYIIIIFCHFFISTHTLTWSVTSSSVGGSSVSVISTHTLTWSVTEYTIKCY